MTFPQPHDPRWQGPQRWYLLIDLIKNIVLTAFCILIIVETCLYRTRYNAYYSTEEYDSDETTADFFIRIGIALIPDTLSTVLTHSLLRRNSFHPVYALTQALVLFGLYLSCLVLNFIIVYSNESRIDNIDAWYAMCYAEMALQGVLMLLWIGMGVCGCVAVHKWRGRKVESKIGGMVRGELELKGVKEGRKDSANVDVEKDALVEGSVKSSRVFV